MLAGARMAALVEQLVGQRLVHGTRAGEAAGEMDVYTHVWQSGEMLRLVVKRWEEERVQILPQRSWIRCCSPLSRWGAAAPRPRDIL